MDSNANTKHFVPDDTNQTLLLSKAYLFSLQLPFLLHFHFENIVEHKVTLADAPSKDVDGFHPENLGRMVLNLPTFLPATPYGIVQLLDRYNVETSGKNCVVIGRSHIVGMPMTQMKKM